VITLALRLGRVSNLPTVWTNVLAGCALAGGAAATGDVRTVGGLLLSSSLAYVGGMYLNDAFDREIDARERPERPIPSGAAKASTVFGAGFAMLAASVAIVTALALQVGPGATPAIYGALSLAATIVAYDMFHKDNPLSPLLMGMCRALVYVTAALLVAGAVAEPVVLGGLAMLGYLFGLTFAAKQENLATFRGGWPLLLLAAPVVLGVVRGTPAGLAMGLLLAVWTALCVRRMHRRDVPGAIAGLIAGISLLDGMLVASVEPWLAAPCLVAFAMTLTFQRAIPGT